MKNRTTLLIALLVLQVLLAGGLYFGKAASETGPARQALVAADKSELDHITIENGEGEKVVLQKTGGRWQLPDYHALPANPAKVETLLERLFNTQGGWPVATSTAAQTRFEVAEKRFQRRITLAKGADVLSELYVGTSPGFRKVHARKANDAAVYAVIFNVFDIPAQGKEWFDRSLIQVQGEVAELEGPDFHLTHINGEWAAIKPDGTVVKEEAEKLLKALTTLQVGGAAEEDPPDNAVTLLVTAGGSDTKYHFFETKGSYFVRHPDYATAFTLSKPDYEQIVGQTGAILLKQTETGAQDNSDHTSSISQP